MTLRVNTIYRCLQGEGPNAGIPMTLVRLQGCPARCSWCDTSYALDKEGGTSMTDDEVFRYIKNSGLQWIAITGGEPLAQDLSPLIKRLYGFNYNIEIETSGLYTPPEWWPMVETWNVDWKCPSSGMRSTMIRHWIKSLRPQDCIKFVVADEKDLAFVLRSVDKIKKATVLMSPVMSDIHETSDEGIRSTHAQSAWVKRVAEFCIEHEFRFSLQAHRIIWGGKRDV